MKKITVLALLILTSLSMYAQDIKQQTTIQVTLKVRKEQVIMGPYSRYAKQYLGVNAPLNNKTIYSIEGAAITKDNGVSCKKSERLVNGNKIVNTPKQRVDFIDVSINPITTGITTRSDADLAKSAAETIFTLRKRRFDMVTGESSDLGAGLGAAVKEMKRLEKEYLSLFIGITSVDYTTYVFNITPTPGKDKYIICRVSDNNGVLSETDVTGEPVLLTVKTMNTLPAAIPTKGKKDAAAPQIQQPEIVECTLFVGTDKLMSESIPMYQYGKVL